VDDGKIAGGRSAADPPRDIELRTMTQTLPALEIAETCRHTTSCMGALTGNHQPFGDACAILIARRIRKVPQQFVAHRVNLVGRTPPDENRRTIDDQLTPAAQRNVADIDWFVEVRKTHVIGLGGSRRARTTQRRCARDQKYSSVGHFLGDLEANLHPQGQSKPGRAILKKTTGDDAARG
jgi:hypothetical protein